MAAPFSKSLSTLVHASVLTASLLFPIYSHAVDEQNSSPEEFVLAEEKVESFEFTEERDNTPTRLENEKLGSKEGKIYELDYSQINDEYFRQYHELTPEKQESFNKKRRTIVSTMAAILSTQKLVIGTGIATKNRISAIIKKEKTEQEKQTIRELGHAAITNILSAFNKKLWEEVKQLADSKESSFILLPGPSTTAALPSKDDLEKLHIPAKLAKVGLKVGFAYGGSVSLGIAIGYNSQSDRIFFDIIAGTEKMLRGLTFFAGAKLLSGLHMDSRDTTNGSPRVAKMKIYAPIGAPIWSGSGDGVFAIGASSAIGLPPPPTTDVFTYESEVTKYRLARVFSIKAETGRKIVWAASSLYRVPKNLIVALSDKVHNLWGPALTCADLM